MSEKALQEQLSSAWNEMLHLISKLNEMARETIKFYFGLIQKGSC